MVETTQERAGVYARQSSGKEKSISEQIAECIADAEANGWTVADTYQDGSSASRYRRRERDDWARALADIDAGRLDVLVLWESSRGDRDAETWLGLLRRCRERNVRIRVTSHNRTYDMANARDWRSCAEDGIDSHFESEKLSLRVRRGVAASAAAGRPPMGRAPYGYRRTYDSRTGALVGQEVDPDTAPIVVGIFDKVARSVPLSEITRGLNERGVPAPLGGQWRRLRVRDIATNVAYLGLRKHKADTYLAAWPALVDEATFYAAGRVLADPARLKLARPGRQVHLLTYLATCSVCATQLHARSTYYCCPVGCVNIRRQPMDDLVRDLVVARLSKPDAYGALRQAGADADREVLAARGEAAKLRAELDEWRLSAARGQTTPASLAVIEAGLSARIREADRVATRAELPPALRQILDPASDVRSRWDVAALPARREIIRALAVVVVRPARQNSYVPIDERLAESRWVGDTRTWGDYWTQP